LSVAGNRAILTKSSNFAADGKVAMTDMTPHETVAHEALSLPVMLPAKLIGREVTLRRVITQLSENKATLLHGLPGVGKTALAATLAAAFTTEHPGGVLWINVDDYTLAELVSRAGRAYRVQEIMGAENPASPAAINALTTTLANQRPLLVLDGRHNPQATLEFVNRCASRLPVLITSDDAMDGPWTAMQVSKLEPDQSFALFKQAAGLSDDMDASTRDIVTRLTAALDYNPFALTVAGGSIRANKQTPAEFVGLLAQSAGAGINPQILALTASFRALPNALQGLLLVLGATFRGQASGELISMISGAPADTINGAMGLLIARGLVERFYRYDIPYYRLHPLTHTFLQSWLRGSQRLEALQNRVRESVLGFARKYSQESAASHDKLSVEMDNFLAMARWAVEQGDRDSVNQLVILLAQAGTFVKSRGYVHDLLTLQSIESSSRTAFTAHQNEALPPAPLAATAAAPVVEEDEDEDFEDVDDGVDPDVSDILPPEDEPATPNLFGRDAGSAFAEIEIDEDDLDEDDEEVEDDSLEDDDFEDDDDSDILPPDDMPLAEEDEEDFEDVDDDGFALIRAAEGDEPAPDAELDEIARLRTALVDARKGGDRRRQAGLLASIGHAQLEAKMENEAIATYAEALTLYENMNDSFGMLATLEALATLTARSDTPQAVVMYATRGITLAKQLNREDTQARLLTILGDARQQLGESDEAERVYTQALELARKSEDKHYEAMILYKLGYAQLDNGEADAAIKTWENSLALFRSQSRRDYEGRVQGGMGTAYGEQGRWTEAISFHSSALHIAREVKDKEEEALQLNNLGRAAEEANQLGQAVLRYRQALHLAYESKNRRNIVSTTVDLARLLVESPRHLNVAALLVEDALTIDPADRDLRRLMERIEDEREADDGSIQRIAVTGTAQDYAANAYKLLDA
jgi:tetratricopeptide (TPR) repeat protein/energy-coupling factor transporter ATP-binding protein EcfA2